MPLLDLDISVINNLVSNCMGMEALYIYDDTKEICKGYGCVIRPTWYFNKVVCKSILGSAFLRSGADISVFVFFFLFCCFVVFLLLFFVVFCCFVFFFFCYFVCFYFCFCLFFVTYVLLLFFLFLFFCFLLLFCCCFCFVFFLLKTLILFIFNYNTMLLGLHLYTILCHSYFNDRWLELVNWHNHFKAFLWLCSKTNAK